MSDLLHNHIATLSQAEAFAAAVQNLPSFMQYREGLETFLHESAEWHDIDRFRFYSINDFGYYESSDNANGGLDVSWAFYMAHREVGHTLIFADEESIAQTMEAAEAEYIRLCEEYRELCEE